MTKKCKVDVTVSDKLTASLMESPSQLHANKILMESADSKVEEAIMIKNEICSESLLERSKPHQCRSPDTLVYREVVKIDENIRNGENKDSCVGMKKLKKKKGSIDEILSQVEAKKRKEELRLKNNLSNYCTILTQPVQNTKDQSLYYSSAHQLDLESIEKERKTKKALKKNKRDISTGQRYSNLTSSQLQRRLIANARERSRVHALSNAFDNLRCAIPSYSPEQKLSKLTILRVAINYINALDEILSGDVMNITENPSFISHVDECSCVLQTEYGRSKSKLSND